MDRAEVLEALAGALPSDALIVDPDIIRSLSHDEAEWAPVGEPLGLIRATSSDQVAASVPGSPVNSRLPCSIEWHSVKHLCLGGRNRLP
jgi:hypothetical protein